MVKSNDGSDPRRRRSLALFSRPTLSSLTPIHDEEEGKTTSKHTKRPSSSRFSLSPPIGTDGPSSRYDTEAPNSPKTRSRPSFKQSRPPSWFGSLRSMHSNDDDERATSPISKSSPGLGFQDEPVVSTPKVVLYHGEVQTTGSMFRKKKEYLVLSETHLIRFKSQGRACEVFPSIPAPLGRSSTVRHSSVPSVGSFQDFQSGDSQSSAERNHGIPLNQIVAAFKLDDGKPFFSIEIASLDDELGQASSMILQWYDPREADLWLSSIRAASTKARLTDPSQFSEKSVEYAARKLELERDYDMNNFKMFKAVQRTSHKGSRSSSDDLMKLASTVCYVVIGFHKLHLISLPKSSDRNSASSLTELTNKGWYGLLSLGYLGVKSDSDAFELTFRLPTRQAKSLHLASCSSQDVALEIRQVIEKLRPQWIEQPLVFDVPNHFEDDYYPKESVEEDYKCFDRTLTAYCAAYEVDTSNIRYTVNDVAEDGPEFELLPPSSPLRKDYSILELLAIMRALRYNESFGAISFRGINMDVLRTARDPHGTEHVPWTTRSGVPINIKGQGQKSLLIQELQGLALKSKRLRRMDFSFCISPRNQDSNSTNAGSQIVEAIFPLCRRQFTNVDWVALNGIELDESDLDYLVDALVQKSCHFRALEISRCGLTDRTMQLILNSMLTQDNTMESIDISGNLARLSPSTFQGQIGHFALIRKINLSRVQRTSGPEPLIAPETLLTWRLEELDLSETPLNEQTVDSIAAYLASPRSDTLREVKLNQCGLTGRDVAIFMHSMSRFPGQARELHLQVSENRLEKGHSELVDAIRENMTPSHLTMKMVEYDKEDHFQDLILALTANTTLKFLDISKASLPYDASEDTCEALKLMFSENKTLEELDISGEHAHLEVAKFGIGLNHALTGLKRNTTLRVLRIEYQKLGLQGASTLGTVLEENQHLREIYCEHNDINLQAFTVLVDGLAQNRSLLYLPSMDLSREEAMRNLKRQMQTATETGPSAPPKYTVRKTLASVGGKVPKGTLAPTQSGYGSRDIQDAIRVLSDKWDVQTKRLQMFLARNFNILHGLPVDTDSLTDGEEEMEEEMEEEEIRPDTGTTLKGTMEAKDGDEGRAFLSLDPSPSLSDLLDEKLGLQPRENKETSTGISGRPFELYDE